MSTLLGRPPLLGQPQAGADWASPADLFRPKEDDTDSSSDDSNGVKIVAVTHGRATQPHQPTSSRVMQENTKGALSHGRLGASNGIKRNASYLDDIRSTRPDEAKRQKVEHGVQRNGARATEQVLEKARPSSLKRHISPPHRFTTLKDQHGRPTGIIRQASRALSVSNGSTMAPSQQAGSNGVHSRPQQQPNAARVKQSPIPQTGSRNTPVVLDDKPRPRRADGQSSVHPPISRVPDRQAALGMYRTTPTNNHLPRPVREQPLIKSTVSRASDGQAARTMHRSTPTNKPQPRPSQPTTKVPSAPKTATRSMPFEEDDDPDIVIVEVKKSNRGDPRQCAPLPKLAPSLSAAERERQLQMSRSLRQQNVQRREGSPSGASETPTFFKAESPSASEKFEGIPNEHTCYEHQGESRRSEDAKPASPDNASSHEPRSAETLPPAHPQSGLSIQSARTTTKAENVDGKPRISSSESRKIPSLEPVEQHHNPSTISTDKLDVAASAPESPQRDAAKKPKQRDGPTKRRDDVMAQLKAMKDRESKEQEESRAAEGREAEAARIANDLKTSTAALQAAARVEQIKKRDAATKARRELDERLEAEAKRKAEEKKQSEARSWEEARRAREKQSKAQQKRAEEARKEAAAINAREGSMAKLKAIKQHNPPHSLIAADTATATQPAADTGTAPVSALPAKTERPQSGSSALLEPASGSSGQQSIARLIPVDGSSGLSEHEAARQQRIQAKQKRNARIQDAENSNAEDDSTREPAARVPATTGPPPIPNGPVSLNINAGQSLLAHSDYVRQPEPAAGNTPQKENVNANAIKRNYGRQLGEILPADVCLLKWRDSGIKFSDIVDLFERAFNYKRAQETLRSRFRQVKDAIRAADVSNDILDLAYNKNQEALVELNKKIHGTWPPPSAKDTAWQRPRDPTGHFITQPKRATPAPATVPAAQAFASSTPLGLQPTPLIERPPMPEYEHYSAEARPQTGGKTINESYLNHHLELMHEEYDRYLEDMQAEREPSPITQEDRCHWAYQVERRQISQDEMEDGLDIDQISWMACSEAVDNAPEANEVALQEVVRVPKGRKAAFDISKGNRVDNDVDDEGLISSTMTLKAGGMVEVRITKFLRTHQDGVLPQSKEGWAPKVVYHVKERTTKTTGDDMFEDSTKTMEETYSHGKTYTTLELANKRAVERWVERTFTSDSVNLGRRKLEEQARQKHYLDQLDEDEDEMFEQSIDTEDGRETFEVWVEDGELEGPRN
ncbi:hypothetical protein LTR37_014343 [Vermiconidia calcicola]|uniref:Uncharacterized protein n=1 Tax=Vermiconidia calcicola TaxID=1690605 RepID=A0ACC3MUP8_9PEZI|nr:hypothetical protein LTR37_014343 [Vermiconidia calcicola]